MGWQAPNSIFCGPSIFYSGTEEEAFFSSGRPTQDPYIEVEPINFAKRNVQPSQMDKIYFFLIFSGVKSSRE